MRFDIKPDQRVFVVREDYPDGMTIWHEPMFDSETEARQHWSFRNRESTQEVVGVSAREAIGLVYSGKGANPFMTVRDAEYQSRIAAQWVRDGLV